MPFTIENIGGKLKSIAVWILVLDLIGAVIALFGLTFAMGANGFFAFLMVLAYVLICVIFCFCLYAFGQLVEDVHSLRETAGNKSQSIGNTTSGNDELPEL